MKSLVRIKDLTQKAWKYLLISLERPLQLPSLFVYGLKGVHVGEFLKLNSPWIKQAGIKTIIDVGAHAGEFASAVRAILPDARIYAFEPLPDCYDKLQKKFAHLDSFRAFNVAIGDKCGQVTFWRSSFSKASSALPMAKLHQQAFPWSARMDPLTVQMKTLDDYLGELEIKPKVLLKLDVQGYENRVLRGGVQILKWVDYLLVEVSFRPLYDGQPSFDEVYEFLVEAGFSYGGNLDQLFSPLDNSILQADALFVRNAPK